MKYVFMCLVFLGACMGRAIGAELITSCPGDYIMVYEPYIYIASGPGNLAITEVGTATSCLVQSRGEACIMYAPTGMEFSDASGDFEFDNICVMN